jgi:hypothetical protein
MESANRCLMKRLINLLFHSDCLPSKLDGRFVVGAQTAGAAVMAERSSDPRRGASRVPLSCQPAGTSGNEASVLELHQR